MLSSSKISHGLNERPRPSACLLPLPLIHGGCTIILTLPFTTSRGHIHFDALYIGGLGRLGCFVGLTVLGCIVIVKNGASCYLRPACHPRFGKGHDPSVLNLRGSRCRDN